MFRGLVPLLLLGVCLAGTPPPGFPELLEEGYPKANFCTSCWSPRTNPYPFNSVDAVFQRSSNGKIYIFVGTNYYRLTDKYFDLGLQVTADEIDAGYPKSIYENWGILGPIDAVVQRPNGKIYFFKGDEYYRVTDKYIDSRKNWTAPDSPDQGYPKKISSGFHGLPDHLDAGFSRVNGYLYFFKGPSYYRIRDKYAFPDEELTDFVEGCYPKAITSGWQHWPAGRPVSAAFQRSTNNAIYLFQGSQYFKYEEKYTALSFPYTSEPDYPKVVGTNFLSTSCTDSGSILASADAVFQRRGDGRIYFFKGSLVYRLNDKYVDERSGKDCIDAGYPKPLTAEFNFGVNPAPSKVDAVIQRANGNIYIFSGENYYKFLDRYQSSTASWTSPDVLLPGYPKPIYGHWKNVPNDLDSAFYHEITHTVYFFKGTQYYPVQDKYFFGLADDEVTAGFPQLIDDKFKDPKGTVRPIMASFYRSNGYIYFFSGTYYWKFNDIESDSAVCQKLTIAESVALINEYQTLVVETPARHAAYAEIDSLKAQIADLKLQLGFYQNSKFQNEGSDSDSPQCCGRNCGLGSPSNPRP